MRNYGAVGTQPRLYQVHIRNPSTNAILQTIYSFSATQETAGDTDWQTHTVNLNAYVGQTIRIFLFENIPESNTGLGQFEIDSISLITTPATASSVIVSGRVTTATGRRIANARVSMTNANGETRTVLTSTFGYFRLIDVLAGETYVFSVFAKRFQFAQSTQVRSIVEERNDIVFVAEY